MAEKRGPSKRQLIIKAALESFSRKGFHKTKMEEIALLAGIGKGTVYEYFPGKAQLFQEVLQEGMELFDTMLRECVSQENTTAAKLESIAQQSILLWQRYQPLARNVLLENTNFDKEFRKALQEKHLQWLRYIESVLEEGISKGEIRDINSTLLARLFYGGMGMIVFPEGNPHVLSRERIAELAAQTVDYYLRGIRKSSTTNNN
ncbi:MAG TPA: TetR/AcrR family transcriptional regulator [Peptococcaceae bacterium]|jgi:AcrR family transcriptional regulator|nr:TetR/AcrR family transcriptional regulator [Clostridia bacterium]HOB82096.1 TetR/AcrR family transcriptional regulator [Peptococcaceae bacterium]HPZ71638.1 TetR/AcrR family transcriptional regulator [Peptococcaceae bacterium]HQD54204.1 TetR/AcrR family transcriptional regulator [Peptococcaceae bacterium]